MPETSPAETMRAAATLMRERVRAATPGPWRCTATSADVVVEQSAGPHLVADVNFCPDHPMQLADADYIASMHPLVATAVADWLAETALNVAELVKMDEPECVHAEPPCDCDRSPRWGCDRCGGWLGADCHCWDDALAVARTYLGETNA